MRAAVLRGKEIVVGDVAEPEPGPGEVLVRTLACGICGSDLHAYHRARRGAAETPAAAPSGNTSPGLALEGEIVMGHEFCAEIADYGPATERRLAAGQRVCSIPILLRASGPEFIGYSSRNPGGYGEFMRLTADHLIAVPNGLSTERAALTEPMSVGWHAVGKARLAPDDVPLVVGCGPVGLAIIAALKLKGAQPIVAADFSPGRRRLAAAMGADLVVDPAVQSPFASWRELAQTGRPDPGPTLPGWLVGSGLKPAVIFECVGARGVIDQLMSGAPQDARIVVVGLCQEHDTIFPMSGIGKELEIIFSNSFHRHEFAETLSNIAEGRIDVDPLITGKVGLAGVERSFRDLENPDAHAKILIEPWRG